MNGAKIETEPIDRSISPATISITSPTARIANGAKYGSSVSKFACVKKLVVLDREVQDRQQRDDDDAALAQRQEAQRELARPGPDGPGL